MALDVGDVRIGVALGDPLGIIATPLTTIERKDIGTDLDAIQLIASDNEVSRIVVGIPYSMSGRKGEQAKATERFVKLLKASTETPVDTIDERLSSVQAEQMLRKSGRQPSREKGRIDSAAAAIILQAYLDSH